MGVVVEVNAVGVRRPLVLLLPLPGGKGSVVLYAAKEDVELDK